MPVPIRSYSKQVVNCGKIDISHVTPKVFTGLKLGSKLMKIKVGDRVIVRRNVMSRENEVCFGWVRYIGPADFASGIWIGIELDKETEDRHDGSIGGKSYFTCPPQRGILIPISRVKRLSTTVKTMRDGNTDSSAAGHPEEIIWEAYCTSSSKKDVLASTKAVPLFSQGCRPKHLLRSLSMGHSQTLASASQKGNSKTNALKRAKSYEESGATVAIGMNALYNHMIGVVKYVGPVEFAKGNWLGLELRENKGKHDGLVHGKRYFISKPGHGIMVKSKNVTIRGINGEKLIGS